MSELAVNISNISKSFGKNLVLEDISFKVEEGQVVCLLGPSGSGKSTLLRCINRLEIVDSGGIHVFGNRVGYEEEAAGLRLSKSKKLAHSRQDIGMVFQRFNLFPHMTAIENIMEAPRRVRKLTKSEARDRALEQLRRVGLDDRADFFPAQLSGGQQQRVAIARALAMEPRIMLFDEPTSALDPELVGEVLAVMKALAAEGMTMIVVTHQVQFALDVADRAVFMADGMIVEDGPAKDVLLNSTHERSMAFFKELQRA